MKKILLLAAIVLQMNSGFAQMLAMEVHGLYEHAYTRQAMASAQVMDHIVQEYPASWIVDYVSVDITATCNNTVVSATGTNDTLTAQQKNLLNTANMGAPILFCIKYKMLNSITGLIDIRQLDYSATIVPDREAQYAAGNTELLAYLKSATMQNISEQRAEKLKLAKVEFVINEQGRVENARIAQSCEDEEMDNLFLKAIENMPAWNAAKMNNGVPVKQSFQLVAGNYGC
jgi:TonB family protein